MTQPAAFSWHGRRVFLTGHTGFKGGWLALWLASKGAIVRGYALDPCTEPNLFTAARIGSVIEDIRGDIRNQSTLEPALKDFAPEVVFHLAAQPLVRFSYADPIGTYETNVIGTARVLDAIRRTPSVRAVVSVTTDKCYENIEDPHRAYKETDPLGGYDPYSSSKACLELVVSAYRRSFFCAAEAPRLATARTGNVIGGGDWGPGRLVPDAVRAVEQQLTLRVRQPGAVRPWQHVLNPLAGYLRLSQALWHDAGAARAWNFGPAADDARPVSWIVERLGELWGGELRWELDQQEAAPEIAGVALDCSAAERELQWRPRLSLQDALALVVEWHRAQRAGRDMRAVSLSQIARFS